jgi:hypothetical protein
MKDYEIVIGMQHLAALVGDGHTFIDTITAMVHQLAFFAEGMVAAAARQTG